MVSNPNMHKFNNPGASVKAVVTSDAGDPGTATGVPGMTYSPDQFPPFDRLYVGTSVSNGDDVKIKTIDGNSVLFKNVLQGSFILAAGTRVLATGTDAADIVQITDRSR